MDEKVFFFLFDQNDKKISSFYWEVSNLDLYQYYTNSVYLDSSSTYYIVDLNGKVVQKDIIVNISGNYQILYSKEYLWDENSSEAQHYYLIHLD